GCASARKPGLQRQGSGARGGPAGTHQRRPGGAAGFRYTHRPGLADAARGRDDVGRAAHPVTACRVPLGVAPTLDITDERGDKVDAPKLVAALTGRRVAVLTGAGISTDSGIPDYRGPDSPPSNPMTIRQFTSDRVFRQRYWARNHVGWRHMDKTSTNAGHRALAALEPDGVVTGVITQTVDLMHTKAARPTV